MEIKYQGLDLEGKSGGSEGLSGTALQVLSGLQQVDFMEPRREGTVWRHSQP